MYWVAGRGKAHRVAVKESGRHQLARRKLRAVSLVTRLGPEAQVVPAGFDAICFPVERTTECELRELNAVRSLPKEVLAKREARHVLPGWLGLTGLENISGFGSRNRLDIRCTEPGDLLFADGRSRLYWLGLFLALPRSCLIGSVCGAGRNDRPISEAAGNSNLVDDAPGLEHEVHRLSVGLDYGIAFPILAVPHTTKHTIDVDARHVAVP